MARLTCEVAVIGSSFAGSLLALCLRRQGFDVVLLDRQKHPRFALGESTTPAADLVLLSLCDRYDLPCLRPLARYGAWKRTYPELHCGPKRGFSYFHHRAGEPFAPDSLHSNELLVTASATDEVSDTNWYRAEVDAFFAAQSIEAGALLLDEARITAIDQPDDWTITGDRHGQPFELRTRFLIDSSGLAAVLPRRLGLRALSQSMQTASRCVFTHVTGLRRWRNMLAEMGGAVDDHPFDCDAAALHHIFDGAWMWVLPFDGGITSVGLTLDARRFLRDERVSPADEWTQWINRHPSVQAQFGQACIAPPFDGFVGTDRIQRLWDVPLDCAAQGWALLPGTHGVVDAFFSTGIAHSMIGIERIAAAFEVYDDQQRFQTRMREHASLAAGELRLIDRLVAASHATFGRHPDLLAAVTMLYFAAATTWEQRRSRGRRDQGFLLADDPAYGQVVDAVTGELRTLLAVAADVPELRARFIADLAKRIAPYNTAGLCDPSAQNMYRYTAAEKHV